MSQQPPPGTIARWDGTRWVLVDESAGPLPATVATATVPPPKAARPFFTRWWVWAVAAVVVGAAVSQANGSSTVPMAAASIEATPAATVAQPSSVTTPVETVTPSVTPSPTRSSATPKPKPKTYSALSSRQFKLLAKDPDSFIGKTYVVYGEVTQFDAATGTDTFRADTGPKKLRVSYGYVDYGQNTILTGKESRLKKLVEGDCFTAKVTVLGSYSYDTQAGGNTTVPSLQADSISVYDSTD